MEKKLYDLKIDPELRDCVPPLSENELAILTQSLLSEGCTDPLTVWDGTIVDGHNRYRICHENNIPFAYEEISFDSKEQAKLWMVKRQLGRRNLKPFQRCAVVFPFQKEISEEVENDRRNAISKFRKTGETTPNLERSEKTAIQLANFADVSKSTWFMAQAILTSGDPDIVAKANSGAISINSAYKQVRDRAKPKEEAKETEAPEQFHHMEEPIEDPVLMAEPERKQLPYQYVVEQIQSAMIDMQKNLKVGLYWLSNEDFNKKKELKQIVNDGCREALEMIDGLEEIR